MDEATQREIAALLVKELSREGLDAVLVGSSAVVALDLFPRSSKDADALGPAGLSLDEGRRIMRAIGGPARRRLLRVGGALCRLA